MRDRKKSRQIYESACSIIPGGVNSPVRSFAALGITPLIVASGAGDTIQDVDGFSYVDYCGSWGALILGHAHPKIVEKAMAQVALGSSFGIATELEQQLAARLISYLPAVEKVRLVSSGTEATMTVLRLARGFTGRSKIVKFNGHYHGHVDALLIQAGSGAFRLNAQASSKGVSAETVSNTSSLPFNDTAAVVDFLRSEPNIAAVILEPITGNMGVVPATAEFIQMLREETQKRQILLIFDEVITGFRVGLAGAQGLYGIKPDLSCFGKVIGGGFPVAAFGGRREIMDHLAPLGEVYQAGTLSGNPVATAAGLQTLLEIGEPGFYQTLTEKTNRITLPIQEALTKKGLNACLNQHGSMFSIFFGVRQVRNKEDLKNLDENLFRKFFIHLFERGIYISPSPFEACFVSMAHTIENLDRTAVAMLDFIKSI